MNGKPKLPVPDGRQVPVGSPNVYVLLLRACTVANMFGLEWYGENGIYADVLTIYYMNYDEVKAKLGEYFEIVEKSDADWDAVSREQGWL